MKSLSLLALSALVVSSASAQFDLVTIDTNRLLIESDKGKALQKDVQDRAQLVQDDLTKKQQDLEARGQKLSKQAAALSADAQQKELMEIRMAERSLQREAQSQQEDLQFYAQTKQAELKGELTLAAKDLAKEKEWGAVLDASQPFVLATADEIDVTDAVLSHVNAPETKSA